MNMIFIKNIKIYFYLSIIKHSHIFYAKLIQIYLLLNTLKNICVINWRKLYNAVRYFKWIHGRHFQVFYHQHFGISDFRDFQFLVVWPETTRLSAMTSTLVFRWVLRPLFRGLSFSSSSISAEKTSIKFNDFFQPIGRISFTHSHP